MLYGPVTYFIMIYSQELNKIAYIERYFSVRVNYKACIPGVPQKAERSIFVTLIFENIA